MIWKRPGVAPLLLSFARGFMETYIRLPNKLLGKLRSFFTACYVHKRQKNKLLIK